MTDATDDTLERARRAVDGGSLPAVAADQALPMAWALKDVCYEAFSVEPPRAARAAALLAELAAQAWPTVVAGTVQALAHWTGGIAHLTQGRMQEAIHSLDAAGAGLQAHGHADPAAQTLVPRIMALSMLGRHDEAIACAEAARLALLQLGNRRAAARVIQNLGSLQLRRDAYPEAARHFREAAVLFARLRDHHHSVLADIGLAVALTSQGDFDEALRIYARARMRAAGRGLELPAALVDESVALLDMARGRYRQALAGLESARRRYERLAMPQYLAVAEKQLADAYLELRLLPEALALLEGAQAQFEALALPDEQAWALAQAGRAQALLGRASASVHFEQAAALFARQGNAVGEAAVALAQAEWALKRGDSQAALLGAQRASGIYSRASVADGQARSDVLEGLACLASGQHARATHVLQHTLSQASLRRQVSVQARCWEALGRLAELQGDAGQARQYYEQAVEGLELQRSALPGSELRSAFLGDRIEPYQGLLRLALAEGQAPAVLQSLERHRARAMGDQLSQLGTQQVGGQAAGIDAGADDASRRRARLNWLYRRVQRLEDANEPLGGLHDEMLRLERELTEDARRQRLVGPAGEGGSWQALDVHALQAVLGPGDVLVEYGESDGELLACLVDAQGCHLVRHLASMAQVQQAVDAARFQLEALRHGAASLQRQMPRLTERAQLALLTLFKLLWAPLGGLVRGARRVLLVPHGPLGQIPFHALHDGQQSLGEACQWCVMPSAAVACASLQAAGLRQAAPPARAWALAEPSQLPHTATEAQDVAALYPQGQALLAEQATVDALRLCAPQADVLHLACHALFRQDNPRFSMLHLHGQALSADEADGLQLRPGGTVVLSACETALSEAGQGNEMVGLVRAFMLAGAARVVASLWPVDDAVAREFMREFHRHLARGEAAAAALAAAQQAVRAVHPHPGFWAAFVLYGAW